MNWHSMTEYRIKMMHFIQQMSPPFYSARHWPSLSQLMESPQTFMNKMFKHAIYKWHPLAVNKFSATTNEKSRFAR